MFPGLKIETSPLSTVQGKCIYKIFKVDNQETQFLLLHTKPSILINIRFDLSKVGSPEADLSANSEIEPADLSAIRVTIFESSGPIY